MLVVEDATIVAAASNILPNEVLSDTLVADYSKIGPICVNKAASPAPDDIIFLVKSATDDGSIVEAFKAFNAALAFSVMKDVVFSVFSQKIPVNPVLHEQNPNELQYPFPQQALAPSV